MADIFGQINNAVFDLQASNSQTFERPLGELACLLDHPELAATNAVLTSDLDLDAFLKESNRTQRGMVGSARLVWPPERSKQLGLVLLLLRRFSKQPEQMIHFGNTFCHAGSSLSANLQSVVRHIVIPFQRDYREHVAAQGRPVARVVTAKSNKVFVVHGHDEGAREAAARFLEKLGLVAVILHEQASCGKTVIEKVEQYGDVAFALVLLTPDDEGRTCSGGELKLRARQNVLLELGYFIARLGRERVCALRRGDVDIPSDFAGVVWTDMDQGSGWKVALARELNAAGLSCDLNQALG